MSDESGFDEASDSGDEAEDDSEDEAPSKKRKAPAPPPTKGKGKGPVQPKKPRKSELYCSDPLLSLVADLSSFRRGPPCRGRVRAGDPAFVGGADGFVVDWDGLVAVCIVVIPLGLSSSMLACVGAERAEN